MNANNFFYLSLGFGGLIIALCTGILTVYLVKTLKKLQNVLDNIDEITKDVKEAEQTVTKGIFGTVTQVLQNLRKKT